MESEEPGSTKPYLIRAIYEWSLDEGFTPQIMVDAQLEGVEVPSGYVADGKIVLNIHPSSVRHMEMGNEYLMFSSRFSGRAENLVVPVVAVLAVYARENGHGIVFQADGTGVSPPMPTSVPDSQEQQESPLETVPAPESGTKASKSKSGNKSASHLKIVK